MASAGVLSPLTSNVVSFVTAYMSMSLLTLVYIKKLDSKVLRTELSE